MRIELPFPHKLLWPNGPRARNHGHMAAVTLKHRLWAKGATLEVKPPCFKHNGAEIPVTIEVHAKRFGPLPDKDNCIAACKAMLDGIADGLGVNDRVFGTPQVVFAPERDGRFVVILGGRPGEKFSCDSSGNVLGNERADTLLQQGADPNQNTCQGGACGS